METKYETAQRLGFNENQVKRFETLSSNKDIIEQVKAEARENEDIASRARVFQVIKEKTKEEKEFEKECKDLDKAHRIYCKINDAVYKPISVEITEENVGYWLEDMSKSELEEEEKQSEFISTASHEMRTPVASIEGYLGLALNPQTATIDDRARQYLEAAHASSQHLGRLFKDLLDVTKLDDGRLKVHEVPVEIMTVVREMAGAREKDMRTKHLKYSFGTTGPVTGDKQIEQRVYAAVDLDFLREILDNLIENAIKYTPDGGEIWVNARGDGDKSLNQCDRYWNWSFARRCGAYLPEVLPRR